MVNFLCRIFWMEHLHVNLFLVIFFLFFLLFVGILSITLVRISKQDFSGEILAVEFSARFYFFRWSDSNLICPRPLLFGKIVETVM